MPHLGEQSEDHLSEMFRSMLSRLVECNEPQSYLLASVCKQIFEIDSLKKSLSIDSSRMTELFITSLKNSLNGIEDLVSDCPGLYIYTGRFLAGAIIGNAQISLNTITEELFPTLSSEKRNSKPPMSMIIGSLLQYLSENEGIQYTTEFMPLTYNVASMWWKDPSSEDVNVSFYGKFNLWFLLPIARESTKSINSSSLVCSTDIKEIKAILLIATAIPNAASIANEIYDKLFKQMENDKFQLLMKEISDSGSKIPKFDEFKLIDKIQSLHSSSNKQ